MDQTHLGRSGLSVSRLCLGTMNFGPETSEEDSHEI
ncbi:MAG: aldoketo-oxidoreductase, NADP-binding, partial [Blastococcus sp.]|nr:aldoketo-oxidoreductase, NADP-binding [Blastococcus sp.]